MLRGKKLWQKNITRGFFCADIRHIMSVRTIFESNSVDYLLPPAGSTGSVMAMGAGGVLSFGQVFTTTCNLDITNPVLDQISLTLQQIGQRVDVYIHGKPLQCTVPGGGPRWGSLVTFATPIPAALIPASSTCIGNVAFQSTGGGAPLMLQVTIAGASVANPGQIAFVYSIGIPAATYNIGNLASDQFQLTSLYIGSYLLA